MHLRYINKLGIPKDIELTGEPLSIGRSREADIPLLDDKVSRVHCGIRLSDGEFYLKDIKSRNGTFVNGQRVEDTVKIKPGDRIQIGSTIFVMEAATSQEDAAKALGSVQDAMGDGKGYSTILKEIVEDMAAPEAPASAPAPEEKPSPKTGRPSIKISMTPKVEPPAPAASPAPAATPVPAAGKKKIVIKM
jgi:predicted component of type VI protein secretion system